MRPLSVKGNLPALFGLLLLGCTASVPEPASASDTNEDDASPQPAQGPCTAPNITVSLDGVGERGFCDGYAAEIMNSLYFSAVSEDKVINVVFSPGMKTSILPGQYLATQWKKPKDRSCHVLVAFSARPPSKEASYSLASGTVDLEISDGEHFKGTFSGDAKNTTDRKEVRKMSGSFDVHLDPSKKVRDFDALDSIVNVETHGKVDLKDTIRHSLRESGANTK